MTDSVPGQHGPAESDQDRAPSLDELPELTEHARSLALDKPGAARALLACVLDGIDPRTAPRDRSKTPQPAKESLSAMSVIVSRGARVAPVAAPTGFSPLGWAPACAAVLMLGAAGCAAPNATPAAATVTVAIPAGLPSSAAGCRSQDVAPTGPPPTPWPSAPITVQYPHGTTPARSKLQAIVQRVISSPAAPPDCGRYAYVHLWEWTADTTVGSDRQATSHLVLTDSQRWHADDGSGRIAEDRFDQPSTAPARRSEDLPAAALPGPLPEPRNADPGILADAIDAVYPRSHGGRAGIRAAADIYAFNAPTLDQRAAIVQILADSAVIWRGTAVDRAGRPGVAVSIDSDRGATRDLLILAPTGDVLAYEQVALRNPGRLDGPFPKILEDKTFLDHHRVPGTTS